MRQEHCTCDSKDKELGWGILSKQDSVSLSGGKDLVFLLMEWDQCAWRTGTRTGLCEMWLEGPGAKSRGGSHGVRDFRRYPWGVGESSGSVT